MLKNKFYVSVGIDIAVQLGESRRHWPDKVGSMETAFCLPASIATRKVAHVGVAWDVYVRWLVVKLESRTKMSK